MSGTAAAPGFRPLRLGLMLLAGLAPSACGAGSPVAPRQVAGGSQAPLRIVADPVVTMTRGESVTLAIEERDATGRVVTQAAASYAWSSSEPGIVTVRTGGILTAGPELGQAIVTAHAASGLTATVRVWVQPPPNVPSAYRITLLFADDVTPMWRREFAAAARRWEQVIRDDLPPVTLADTAHVCSPPPGEPAAPALHGVERGTRIYVGYSGRFPPGTSVTAAGGPCLQRPLPRPTSIFGTITLNRDKSDDELPLDRVRYVALHEIGHTLGLAGVVQGVLPPWLTLDHNMGPLALEGYRRVFGASVSSIPIPGAHWGLPSSVDVMATGGQGAGISLVSIGGLMDLGYPTAWYAADQ